MQAICTSLKLKCKIHKSTWGKINNFQAVKWCTNDNENKTEKLLRNDAGLKHYNNMSC
jgi:hypothetical protein